MEHAGTHEDGRGKAFDSAVVARMVVPAIWPLGYIGYTIANCFAG